jgi:hypothetical protein
VPVREVGRGLDPRTTESANKSFRNDVFQQHS